MARARWLCRHAVVKCGKAAATFPHDDSAVAEANSMSASVFSQCARLARSEGPSPPHGPSCTGTRRIVSCCADTTYPFLVTRLLPWSRVASIRHVSTYRCVTVRCSYADNAEYGSISSTSLTWCRVSTTQVRSEDVRTTHSMHRAKRCQYTMWEVTASAVHSDRLSSVMSHMDAGKSPLICHLCATRVAATIHWKSCTVVGHMGNSGSLMKRDKCQQQGMWTPHCGGAATLAVCTVP